MPSTSMPNLFTTRIEAALAFYTDELGFAESFRFPAEGEPEHVVLRLGGSLLALSKPRSITAAGLEPTAGNPFELVVWTDDVDADTARLAARGVTVARDPYDHPAGHRRSYVVDPDGNWIALVDAPTPTD